ncbi:MAG: recombinase family protein [Bacteroidales bacterium]|nr:recombinase family protein [Bacteroidales bacterium]
MSVYAYIRVSTEMQCHASQKHEIKVYCEKRGLIVDKWVSESVSGTVAPEKRLLGKSIRKMKKGDLLICTELSRLGRSMLMIMGILNRCSQKGISIQTIKDNFTLTDNINSKIIAFAFALAAEIERNLISQRTKEALAVKRLEGVRLGRPPGSSRKKVTFIKEFGTVSMMLANGMTVSQIAKQYGIHRNTMRKYLDEMQKIKDK